MPSQDPSRIDYQLVWLAAKQLQSWKFLGTRFNGDPYARALITPCIQEVFNTYAETAKARSAIPAERVSISREAVSAAENSALEREAAGRAQAQTLWKKIESDNVEGALHLLRVYLLGWEKRDEHSNVVKAYEQRISTWVIVFDFMKEYATAEGVFTLDVGKERKLAEFFGSPSSHDIFRVDYQNNSAPLSATPVPTAGVSRRSTSSADTSNAEEQTGAESTAVFKDTELSFVPNIGPHSFRSAKSSKYTKDTDWQTKNRESLG